MRTLLSSIPCVVALLGLLLGGGASANAQTSSPPSPPTSYPAGDRAPEVLPDVIEELREHDQYSVLISALERTGIDQGLRIHPSFTLLAPTDSAFAALEVRLSELESYEVAEILRNHVIRKALTTRQLQSLVQIENTRGLSFQVEAGATTIGGATLVEPDLMIENGIIHGIDTVLTMKAQTAPVHSFRGSVHLLGGVPGVILKSNSPSDAMAHIASE